MTLWDKGQKTDDAVLAFSAGNEYMLDQRLVPHDCDGSIAHARTLHKAGLLGAEDTEALIRGLDRIKELHSRGDFRVRPEQEDCHTAIEEWLTGNVGPAGAKIHLGRSRNDQVLTALRLCEKALLAQLSEAARRFQDSLREAILRQGHLRLPGYTHMQRAMPTTVGVWLGAFVDAVDDDLALQEATAVLIDQSPLGTGAGYGIPVFELDREWAAGCMGFRRVQRNPVYAQLSRGKFEGVVLNLLSQIMFNLNRLATDLLVFTTSEFGFVSLPEAFYTGSSIMPQKKNPDILELVRGKYHMVVAAEFEVKHLIGNLMSGYQRDLGLTKEPLFKAFDTTLESLNIMSRVAAEMEIDARACAAAMTREIYATEEAYRLVQAGMPFRDAYRKIGEQYVK
jgi:argininosuccinate lyase